VSSEQNSIFLMMNVIVYYWTHIQHIIMELSVKHLATHMSAFIACMHMQVHLMLCDGKMCVSHSYTVTFVHNSPRHIVSPILNPPPKFNVIIDICMKGNQIIHHRFIKFNEREGY
jgi:hypothetical protein